MDTNPMMRVLAASIRARVPVLLWGAPGVGKTAVIESMGAQSGFTVETVIGSIREASDFLGLPIEVDGQVRYAPPSWARRLAESDRGLLFLDELTTAAPSVQRAMLRVLQERQVGELALPDSVAIVAAANPPSVAVDGWDLAAPIANRLLHLDWAFDSDRWLAGVMTLFEDDHQPGFDVLLRDVGDTYPVRVRGAVAAFLRSRPDLHLAVPADPSRAGRAWPSPRSWTNAIRVLSALPSGDGDAALLALRGCVGEAAAAEYIAWLAANDLYDPAEVLDNPGIVDWRSRPDRIFALLSAVVTIAKLDGGKVLWGKAMAVLTACGKAKRPDLAFPGARTLLQHIPAGARCPAETREVFTDLMQRSGLWAA